MASHMHSNRSGWFSGLWQPTSRLKGLPCELAATWSRPTFIHVTCV